MAPQVYQSFFGANYYRTIATIDMEILPEEDVLTLLESISENVNKENAKIDEDNEVLESIVEFNYSLLMNKRDSVLLENMNAEEKSEWRIESSPIEISITTILKIDSTGYVFLDYLNNHNFIQSKRLIEIQDIKNEINSIEKEIANLDSIQNVLIRSKRSKKSGTNNVLLGSDESTLYDLVKYRNDLSMELRRSESKLVNLNENELNVVNKFSSLREVKKDSLTNPLLYVKILFYSILFMIFLTVVRKLFV